MSEFFDESGGLHQNGRALLKQIAISLSKSIKTVAQETSTSQNPAYNSDAFIMFSRLLIDAIEHEQGAKALYTLDNERLLSQFIPDFELMRNCTQNDFHHKPVLAHTFEALEHLDDFIDSPSLLSDDYEKEVDILICSKIGDIAIGNDEETDEVGVNETALNADSEFSADSNGGVSVRAALRFAMLFHDIAKPASKVERPDGHITFYEHDLHGANIASEFASAIPELLSSASAVHRLIRNHQLLGFLARDEQPNMKSVNRFISKLGKLTPAALILCISDRMAARGPSVPQDNIDRHFDFAQVILDAFYNPPPPPPKPLLSGQDIMTILGIDEGPKIGRILTECEKRRRMGWLKDRESALDWLKSMKR